MPTFQEVVRELVAKKGQGTVADKIGMDPTRFCRALSGQAGFKEKEVDALLTQAEYELAPAGYKKYHLHLMFAMLEFVIQLKGILKEHGIEIGG